MLKRFIILLLLVFSGYLAFTQKINADKVPTAILSKFKERFPEATKVKWIKEDNQNYEAEFKMNRQDQSVVYDPDANWIESEIEIKISELPLSVKETLKHQFPGYKIEEASKIDDKANGKGYEVEIEKSGQTLEVRLSANGDFLNKKLEEKKREKD
jgi:hypothetical protein